MENRFSIRQIIKYLKKGDYLLHYQMPVDYTAGLPVIVVKNDNLCMMVPFLKYRITGKPDNTLVYPIRYVITVDLPVAAAPKKDQTEAASDLSNEKPEIKIVKFEDLSYNPMFGKLDFNAPCGLFRHDAIKQFNKKQYNDLRSELLSLYDVLVNSLLDDKEMNGQELGRMRELFGMLVEPSLLSMYKTLDKRFYESMIG